MKLKLITLLGMFVLCFSVTAQAGDWDFEYIGSFNEDNIYDFNNAGQIVGAAYDSSARAYLPFMYDSANGMSTIALEGAFAERTAIFDINDVGQMTGYYYPSGLANRALLHTPGSGTVALGTYPSTLEMSIGRAVNNSGVVAGDVNVGGSSSTHPEQHAFLYTPGSGMRDLGHIGGGRVDVSDMNNSGQIVGGGHMPNYDWNGFVWDEANGMRSLGTLAGSSSQANAINDQGTIVGSSTYDPANPDNTIAFKATYELGIDGMGYEMRSLGALGGDQSMAYDVNNSDQIVGWALRRDDPSTPEWEGNWHAFLYEDGAMLDLNQYLPENSGMELLKAVNINDFGQIVVTGTMNNQQAAFLMTPNMVVTPEPLSCILFATGLGAIGVARRKKKL